ncbi:MAG: hypothetical protein EA424_10540 [Planctomycetaceae bacterium]|nr:MAG: hypothetical protein EA424_10540 [Planctomycetaceae bacterium]
MYLPPLLKDGWHLLFGHQNHHRVYDRAGQRCGSCGHGLIQRIVQAQRSSFFCPNCQTRTP